MYQCILNVPLRNDLSKVTYSQIHGSPVFYSKVIYSKVSSRFLRQDSQSSYSFGKIQNVGSPKLFEEKVQCIMGERFRISFSHLFSRQFCFLFPSFNRKKKSHLVISSRQTSHTFQAGESCCYQTGSKSRKQHNLTYKANQSKPVSNA